MTELPWYAIALWLLASMAMLSAIYAVIFGLVARFGMGVDLRFRQSYLAAFIGLPVGFLIFGLGSAGASQRHIQGIVPILVIALGAMLAMAAVNVLAVRTRAGERINFIQAFFMQLVPNLLMVAWSVMTRPVYYY